MSTKDDSDARTQMRVSITGGDVRLVWGRPGPAGSYGRIDDAGRIEVELRGKPPRGREDELAACTLVVSHLNNGGASWTPPTMNDVENDPVDAFTRDNAGNERFFQVARIASEQRWQTLGRTGSATEALTLAAVGDELYDAIEKKAQHYAHDLASLDLVIDTMRLPSHTFPQVLEALRARHRDKIVAFGFRAVWIVGPRPDLVHLV